MHFELRAVEEDRASSLGVDAEDLALVAGADKQRTIAGREQRPEKRRRRLVDELGGGAEDELTVHVDRQVFDVAAEKIGLRLGLKEFRRGRVDRCQREDSDSAADERGIE